MEKDRKAHIIDRIMNLTDEQFELLLTLYSQRAEESAQDDQARLQASA